jgi:glycosyltransferase involved in cell wall biosynthesis
MNVLGPGGRPPDVSVIMPAYNSSATLPDQLAALARQDFDGSFEIVIADNGSSDDLSGAVARAAVELDGRAPCRIVDGSRSAGPGYARTIALLHARGERIAFCDADDVVDDGWLAALVSALDEADVVTGSVAESTSSALEELGPERLFATLSFAVGQSPGGIWGGNSAFRRAALSGFAPDLLYKMDNATGLRALDAGFRWAAVEEARLLYRQPERPTAQFHRGYLNGAGRVQLFREFPEIGYHLTSPWRSLAWIVLKAPLALTSRRRNEWSRITGSYVGSVVETWLPGLSGGVLRARRAKRRLAADGAG